MSEKEMNSGTFNFRGEKESLGMHLGNGQTLSDSLLKDGLLYF